MSRPDEEQFYPTSRIRTRCPGCRGERWNRLVFESYTEIEGKSTDPPLVLEVEVSESCAGCSFRTEIINLVIAIRPALRLPGHAATKRSIPVDENVRPAVVALVYIVNIFLQAPPQLEIVSTRESREHAIVELVDTSVSQDRENC